MEIIYHPSVDTFISELDKPIREKVYRLLNRLRTYGKDLPMPDVKPIGRGLWELRIRGHPAIRIMYAFNNSYVFLLVAFKKQHNAIRFKDIALAKERLKIFIEN
jgi:phage-related protein